MNQDFLLYVAKEAIYTVLLISGPLLIGSVIVGLAVSIFQATTSIQEQTLSFVPKILFILLGTIFFGPWMLNVLLAFTHNLLVNIPYIAR